MLPTLMRLAAAATGIALLSSCLPEDPAAVVAARPGAPAVRDDRLRLTLFAEDPKVATPIGIAIDGRDRIFVLESHTHLTPAGYTGPRGDRVKIFVDPDRDGRSDGATVFAEGIEDGMNLAFSPAGELYVVTSRAVWALHDRDGDGVSEARTRVIAMTQPEQVYDHAALLGITFSADGWLYLSRGNTGGAAWRLQGTDGSAVSGYGDGGNIVRSRPDGTRLEEVATGFWNPFDLKFDARGRLLAADNDPDSRGPNRLVHVVPGGDYGYRSLFGESGIHPYLAWNGELPGTLPYAAALGEAPSGILDATLTSLPGDYRDSFLATIWEESRIVRVKLRPDGASVTGEAEPLVEGGPDFRPVALAADRHGAIYLTDWVLREYPNHGRGRIWRLGTARGATRLQPRAPFGAPPAQPWGPALEPLYSAGPADFDRLRDALRSSDPFVRTAAVTALAAPSFAERVAAATRDPDARVRLGALLALRRGGNPGMEPVAQRLLSDPDPAVRRMALIWAGGAGMLALRPHLERAIHGGTPTPELFESYLATVELLDPGFVAAYRGRSERYAKNLKRSLPPRFLESFIADAARDPELRARAVSYLADPAGQAELLMGLARAGQHPSLRREAVRSLATATDERVGPLLLEIARTPGESAELRADALLSLSRQQMDAGASVLALLDDPDPEVRLEAARYLRSHPPDDAATLASAARAREDGALREQLAMLGEETDADRPKTVEEWQRALARGGSVTRGRRVFHSTRSMCSQCHAVERRGGDVGPDLTNVGRSKSRAQIVHSIVRPSDEISPEYQGWFIRTRDGKTHHGRQIDVGGDGAQLYVLPGRFATFRDIVEYGTVKESLMPEGLESALTVSDMRDLVAFLEQAR